MTAIIGLALYLFFAAFILGACKVAARADALDDRARQLADRAGEGWEG